MLTVEPGRQRINTVFVGQENNDPNHMRSCSISQDTSQGRIVGCSLPLHSRPLGIARSQGESILQRASFLPYRTPNWAERHVCWFHVLGGMIILSMLAKAQRMRQASGIPTYKAAVPAIS